MRLHQLGSIAVIAALCLQYAASLPNTDDEDAEALRRLMLEDMRSVKSSESKHRRDGEVRGRSGAISLKQLMLEDIQAAKSAAIGPAASAADREQQRRRQRPTHAPSLVDSVASASEAGLEPELAAAAFPSGSGIVGGAPAAVGIAMGVGAVCVAAIAATVGIILRYRNRTANSLERCKKLGGTQ